MIRRLSTFIFVISMIAWLAAVAVYVRSKFRADVITIVTPGRACLIAESYGGEVELTGVSPWPGARRFLWSAVDAGSTFRGFPSEDQLLKPDFQLTFAKPQRFAKWRRFLIAGGWSEMLYYTTGADDREPEDRDWRAGPTFEGTPQQKGTKYFQVFFPSWSMLIAFSVIPCLWSATAGRHRWRRRLRLRRGLCVQCGYDLRQTPVRCPECGWRRVAGNPI